MSAQKNPLTIVDLLNRTNDYFKKKEINHSRLSAEWLLAYVLKLDRIQLYLQYDRLLTSSELDVFRELVKRRAEHEPLQYIIGEAEFMGLKFKVSPSVLIPRPETELLVEKVLLLKDEINSPVIWDIGTGSGCIAVSIVKLWPDCNVIASDISTDALIIAEENIKQHNLGNQIRLLNHNILNNEIPSTFNPDIIVSNPPYIGTKEMVNLDVEVKSYEPRLALTDEKNGLLFYERIFSLIEIGLKGKFFLLELSGTQADKIIEMAEKLGVDDMKIFNDLNEIPRILQIRKK